MKIKRKIGIAALISIIVFGIFAVSIAQRPNDNIYSLVKLSSDIAFKINARYVDSLDVQSLVYSGIRGMLDNLDPFSEFLEKKDYDILMEATSGKYSGLGMTIFLKDNWVTVVAPMEGTPAYRMGVRAGDRIIQIDDKSAKGMSTSEASKLMRGEAGTKVKLTIEREGVVDPLEYTMERAVITIKTVPFSGVMDENGKRIGYIRLSRFGEGADSELDQAIEEMSHQKLDGLIFDLRSNGGGLLDQAIKVSNYYLPKGTEIVSTKGRTPDQDRVSYATNDALVPKVPLVVLVNEGSASASEIVAGAIQDSDRGVLIGNTTFGKGLVQQIYQLTEGTALKLTTAKYYVPSGRCIQKDIRSTRHPEDLAGSDTVKIDSTKLEVFHTKSGRKVYAGGGVTPDIVVNPEKLNPLEINLERLSIFFDFSIKYTNEHPKLPPDFEVDDAIMSEFKDFLKEKKFTYKSDLENSLDQMKKVAKDTGRESAFAAEFDRLATSINADKENEFNQSLDYIKRSIKRDVLTRLYSESEVYRQLILKTDPYVKKAVEVLTSPKEYADILGG